MGAKPKNIEARRDSSLKIELTWPVFTPFQLSYHDPSKSRPGIYLRHCLRSLRGESFLGRYSNDISGLTKFR